MQKFIIQVNWNVGHVTKKVIFFSCLLFTWFKRITIYFMSFHQYMHDAWVSTEALWFFKSNNLNKLLHVENSRITASNQSKKCHTGMKQDEQILSAKKIHPIHVCTHIQQHSIDTKWKKRFEVKKFHGSFKFCVEIDGNVIVLIEKKI